MKPQASSRIRSSSGAAASTVEIFIVASIERTAPSYAEQISELLVKFVNWTAKPPCFGDEMENSRAKIIKVCAVKLGVDVSIRFG